MPTVVLARNLGRDDIKKFQLDASKQYLEGQEVEVSQEAHEELLKRKLVLSDEEIARQKTEREQNEQARAREQESMQGVARQPAITAPAKPETFGKNPRDPAPAREITPKDSKDEK